MHVFENQFHQTYKISIGLLAPLDSNFAEPEPSRAEKHPSYNKLRSMEKMDLYTYKSVDIVFNTFANKNQKVGTVLESASVRNNAHFIYVAALGKTKNYSRVEMLHSFFRGC